MVPEPLGVRGQVELVPSLDVFPADEVERDGPELFRVEGSRREQASMIHAGGLGDDAHADSGPDVRQDRRPPADLHDDLEPVGDPSRLEVAIEELADPRVRLGKDQGEPGQVFGGHRPVGQGLERLAPGRLRRLTRHQDERLVAEPLDVEGPGGRWHESHSRRR